MPPGMRISKPLARRLEIAGASIRKRRPTDEDAMIAYDKRVEEIFEEFKQPNHQPSILKVLIGKYTHNHFWRINIYIYEGINIIFNGDFHMFLKRIQYHFIIVTFI